MKLPVIAHPLYDVQLLSQSDSIKIRPFTVREEKLMLMATEAKDLKTTIDALKQIINNCVVSPNFDVDNIAMIDMETIFLNLRARSIGEQGFAYYKCKNMIEDPTPKECGMVMDLPIDFLKVPIINTGRDKRIMFTDTIGVQMKYPTFGLIKHLIDVPENEVESTIAMNCIDLVFDENSVYKGADCTQDELAEFIDNLPADKYEQIKAFINNLPKTHLEIKRTCTKCGFKHEITLEGVEDFFT